MALVFVLVDGVVGVFVEKGAAGGWHERASRVVGVVEPRAVLVVDRPSRTTTVQLYKRVGEDLVKRVVMGVVTLGKL